MKYTVRKDIFYLQITTPNNKQMALLILNILSCNYILQPSLKDNSGKQPIRLTNYHMTIVYI